MLSSSSAGRKLEKLGEDRAEFFQRVERQWGIFRFILAPISYPIALRTPDMIQRLHEFWPGLLVVPMLGWVGWILIRKGREPRE